MAVDQSITHVRGLLCFGDEVEPRTLKVNGKYLPVSSSARLNKQLSLGQRLVSCLHVSCT